jgi:hypothetical protein
MRATTFAGLVVAAAAAATTARAQGNYEIEVYNSLVAPTKTVILELHTNYTFDGQMVPLSSGSHAPVVDDDLTPLGVRAATSSACHGPTVFFDKVALSRQATLGAAAAAATTACTNNAATSHIGHETVEATMGLTSWSEIGMYAFSNEDRVSGVQYVGTSLRPKVRVPDSWRWPVGVALSMELEYDRPKLSTDTWSWEIRPIIDKAIGRWYASVNPTLVRTLQGTGVVNGLELSPSAKTSFDFTPIVSAGVEYYSAYGRIGRFAPPADRIQQIFGVTDLHVSPLWEINFGVGIAATTATNHLVAKLILGRSLSWDSSLR